MIVELDGANLARRRDQPSNVTKDCKRAQRLGGWAPPPSYTAFHQAIAEDVLESLVAKHRLRVVEKGLRDSGNFDGVRQLNAIVEDRYGRVHRLVYCAFNQGFLKKCDGGGEGFFKPEETFGI